MNVIEKQGSSRSKLDRKELNEPNLTQIHLSFSRSFFDVGQGNSKLMCSRRYVQCPVKPILVRFVVLGILNLDDHV